MNIYTKRDGTEYTGHFMRAPTLSPGCHWWNTSPLGQAPQHFVERVTVTDSGRIFGYEPADLMARQYRPERTT